MITFPIRCFSRGSCIWFYSQIWCYFSLFIFPSVLIEVWLHVDSHCCTSHLTSQITWIKNLQCGFITPEHLLALSLKPIPAAVGWEVAYTPPDKPTSLTVCLYTVGGNQSTHPRRQHVNSPQEGPVDHCTTVLGGGKSFKWFLCEVDLHM